MADGQIRQRRQLTIGRCTSKLIILSFIAPHTTTETTQYNFVCVPRIILATLTRILGQVLLVLLGARYGGGMQLDTRTATRRDQWPVVVESAPTTETEYYRNTNSTVVKNVYHGNYFEKYQYPKPLPFFLQFESFESVLIGVITRSSKTIRHSLYSHAYGVLYKLGCMRKYGNLNATGN